MNNIQSENLKEPRLRIFISLLPKTIKKEEIIAYFSSFGQISNCRLSNFPNGKFRGLATIGLAHKNAFDSILQADHSIKGRKIKVAPYRRKKANQGKNKTVMISNVPINVQKEDLKKYFGFFGKIDKLILNDNSSQNKNNFNVWTLVFTNAKAISKIKKNSGKVVRFHGVHLLVTFPEKKNNLDSKIIGEGKKNNNSLQKGLLDWYVKDDNNKVQASLSQAPGRYTGAPKQVEGKCTPSEDPQSNIQLFENEFKPAEELSEYVRLIQIKNPQVGIIKKKALKFLELFYFNDRNRRRNVYKKKNVSYYTMVRRPALKIEKNHTTTNMRLNKMGFDGGV